MPSSSCQQYRKANPEISLCAAHLIACKRKEHIQKMMVEIRSGGLVKSTTIEEDAFARWPGSAS
jgi:hypothetical protein